MPLGNLNQGLPGIKHCVMRPTVHKYIAFAVSEDQD